MRFLYISSSSELQIFTSNLDSTLLNIFSNNSISRSTFDGITDYYHLSSSLSCFYPPNKIATHFKRLYSSDYSINNVVRGDILITSSLDNNPSVMSYFLEQVLLYYVTVQKTIS